MGYIHSLESFGTVDGPGVRFVVFFEGCPMRWRRTRSSTASCAMPRFTGLAELPPQVESRCFRSIF